MTCRNQQGFALLAAMLGLAIITILVEGMVLTTRDDFNLAQDAIKESEARVFGHGATLLAVVALLDPVAARRPRIDGLPVALDVLSQTTRLRVWSEFGKVDINAADKETLARLFRAAGLAPDHAADQAQRVAAFRGDGRPADQRRRFRMIDEMTWVPGLDDGIYARVADAITVYSGHGAVDRAVASALALQAISGVDQLQAEAIIRARSIEAHDDALTEVSDGRPAAGVSLIGWAFTVEDDFQLAHRSWRVTDVVRLTGDNTHPYLLLRDDLTVR